MSPSISIVIPAYNAEAHLRRVLPLYPESPDLEVIVVANGCSDATAKVAQEIRPSTRVLVLPVGSVSLARDVGLRAAKGPYVAFRDADDEPVSDSFARLAKHLDDNPECDLVSGGILWVVDGVATKTSDYLSDPDELFADCLFRAPLLLAASMLRKSRFESMPYCALYTMGEDWHYLWQMFKAGRVAHTIPDIVLRYIRHTSSATADMPAGNTLRDFVTVLRAQFMAECGVYLTPDELMVFVNTAPCAYWTVDEVPFIRTLHSPRESARQVLEKVARENKLIPKEALVRRIATILGSLPE